MVVYATAGHSNTTSDQKTLYQQRLTRERTMADSRSTHGCKRMKYLSINVY